jgi:hypothetical protein
MTKHYIKFTILISLIYNNFYSQEFIKTDFYNIKLPQSTIAKTFASTHEELSNIDAYQFIINEKPKYILYLMSNKTNVAISNINNDNYKDFLYDLGELKVVNIEIFKNKIKINFAYKDNDSIKGIVYLSITNDILNRFVFLLPNDKAKELFEREIDEIIYSIVEIKKNWTQ